MAVLIGPIQDYAAYILEWQRVLAGADPYVGEPINAYGPLFNTLAALVWLHPLTPKLLFVAVWLGTSVWLVRRAASRWVVAVFLLSPWFWFEVPGMGHFDVVVGGLCLAAVHLTVHDRRMSSAVLLAAAFLFKLLPIFLLPLVVLGQGSFRRRAGAVLAFAGVTVAGLALAYLAWGPSVATPFLFGEQRCSNGFSIWNALRADDLLIGPLLGRHDFDWLGNPTMLAAVAAAALLAWRLGTTPALAALLISVASLAACKLGHSQFFMTPALLAAYLVGNQWSALGRRLRIALAAYFGWLTLLGVIYVACRGCVSLAAAGWFHFAVSVFLIVELVRTALQARREALPPTASTGWPGATGPAIPATCGRWRRR